MTCLVTGANGFVGSAVVRALLAQGFGVRAMTRAGSDATNLAGLDVERVEADLTAPDSLRAAVRGCRAVFHVAADYRLWTSDPAPMYAANVEGSLNVLNVAAEARVERLVYTSSVAVLGSNADGTPADEDTPVTLADMVGHYKRSKYLAEQALTARARDLGTSLVIVNPSTPIGPGDLKPTPTGRVIVDAARGRIPAFVDTGLNIVHVDDVARGHVLAFEHGRDGERYVLGGTDMSLKGILEVVAAQCGRRPPTWKLPRWSVYPVAVVTETLARATGREPLLTLDGLRMSKKLMYFSSAKAERELGYAARPPAEAIADALEWFTEHGYVDGTR